MSHVVTIKSEVRDATAVRAACQRLGLPQPVEGTHRLFTSSATGLLRQLSLFHSAGPGQPPTYGRAVALLQICTFAVLHSLRSSPTALATNFVSCPCFASRR